MNTKFKVGDKVVGPTNYNVCGAVECKVPYYKFSIITDINASTYDFDHYNSKGKKIGRCGACIRWNDMNLQPYANEVTAIQTTSLLKKFTVFTHDECPIQLWERDGTVQLRKSGRKGKSFTVTGDLDQWASAFFDGYLSAQPK